MIFHSFVNSRSRNAFYFEETTSIEIPSTMEMDYIDGITELFEKLSENPEAAHHFILWLKQLPIDVEMLKRPPPGIPVEKVNGRNCAIIKGSDGKKRAFPLPE